VAISALGIMMAQRCAASAVALAMEIGEAMTVGIMDCAR
jgi:hypothetical protein